MQDNEYGTTTEKLQTALRHYGPAEDFPLVAIPTLTELVNAYTQQPGDNHWFDKDTLQAHGSQMIRMISPGIILEEQRPAYRLEDMPDKVWKITGWVRNKAGRITPITVAAKYTKEEGEAFAITLAQVWADHSNPNYPAPR